MMHGDSLPAAIREFQADNNLKQTGHINQATLNVLNIPPAQRYRELVVSMNEWAKYPEDQNSRYIQVNIPSYSMKLISHGETALQMKAIVGRPSRPTPLLTSKVTTIVFNPSWTVPETILAKDVIPGMQKNPSYMKEHYDMRVYANYRKDAPEMSASSVDWQTASVNNFKYRVTAPPSEVNPLGRFKFIFANDHDVYMHDTPEKAVFAMNDRARSSGCIRLEDSLALVQYFYADNADLNAELVSQYLSTYQTKYIQLRNPIPVYITYIPAWVDTEGHAHFADDIYQRKANA
jgi:murein L,D-transpeptidase YcbB/YkuD